MALTSPFGKKAPTPLGLPRVRILMICWGVRLRVMPLMSVGIMLTKLSGTAINLHIKTAASSDSTLIASHDMASRAEGNQEAFQ